MTNRITWKDRFGPAASGADGFVGQLRKPLFAVRYGIIRGQGYVLNSPLLVATNNEAPEASSVEEAKETAEQFLSWFVGKLGAQWPDEKEVQPETPRILDPESAYRLAEWLRRSISQAEQADAPEEAGTAYRVWGLFRVTDAATWLPISQRFTSHAEAAEWAKHANTTEVSIDAEDMT